MPRFICWIMLSCVLLAACQSSPFAAYSYVTKMVYGDDVLWVGTSSGVVRIDPDTRTYTTFKQLGRVSQLLPIENGQVFAASNSGLYFFDGQVWNPVVISMAQEKYLNDVNAIGIATDGDLWLQAEAGRGWVTFQLAGHIPPHDKPWLTKAIDTLPFSYNPIDCNKWHALAASSYTYRSSDECQTYSEAQRMLKQHELYGYFVLDANSIVWLQAENRLLRLASDGSTQSQWSLSNGSRLAPNPQGGIWVATPNGLSLVTESTWEQIPLNPK